MGLNEAYQVVRSNILMLNPLPSVSQACSIVIQEEQLREIKTHHQAEFGSSAFLSQQRMQFNQQRFNQQQSILMETIKPTLLRSFLSSRKTLLNSRRSRKWLNFVGQSWQCPTNWCWVHSLLTRYLSLVWCKICWTHGLRAHIIF